MGEIIKDQPAPQDCGGADVWQLLIDEYAGTYPDLTPDMRERQRIGLERYGVPVRVANGRDHLADCYQELLDATVYLRAEMEKEGESDPILLTALWDTLRTAVTLRWRMDSRSKGVSIAGS